MNDVKPVKAWAWTLGTGHRTCLCRWAKSSRHALYGWSRVEILRPSPESKAVSVYLVPAAEYARLKRLDAMYGKGALTSESVAQPGAIQRALRQEMRDRPLLFKALCRRMYDKGNRALTSESKAPVGFDALPRSFRTAHKPRHGRKGGRT